MNRGWTDPSDVVARVRRRWDDGSLLAGHAAGAPFATLEVPLRGPSASQIGDDLEAVREWITRLDAGRHDDRCYALEWGSVGGRRIGRNQVPTRAVVSSYDQAWALLRVAGEVRRFEELLALTSVAAPVRAWVARHPHRALELGDELPRLLAAHDWLDAHRGSQHYLREISAPGVDTKFAERHRAALAEMLGVASSPTGFLAGLGMRTKPEFVRLRVGSALGVEEPLTELGVRAEELVDLAVAPRIAWVVENEISYLSVPVPVDGIVVWGKGFEVDRVGRLPWLTGVDVRYWGDLDTHGFAILDRLRAWLPQTRSVLMDRATLVAHRDRWGVEDRPTRSRLTRLTPDEDALYTDLVEDRLAERLRLEQERVAWPWVAQRLGGDSPG